MGTIGFFLFAFPRGSDFRSQPSPAESIKTRRVRNNYYLECGARAATEEHGLLAGY